MHAGGNLTVLLPLPLLGAIGLGLGLCTSGLPAQADERKAAVDLAKAMDLAGKGHYAQAVAAYARIAKKYPRTGAGMVAERRSQQTAFLGWAEIARNGPSQNRLDVVIMGDGYRLQDQNEFDDVADSIPKLFKNHKVLGEYYSYHNFLRGNLRSKDQGVTGFGRKYDTALGGHVTGSVQGHVAVDASRVRRHLSEVEDNDGFTIAIVKAGSMGTGDRGIAAIGGRSDDTIIHEWGHAFGGLSDEYSSFTGHRGAPHNGVNISKDPDPKKAQWWHWIEKKAPGVGMYRGGDGRVKGVWRPTASGCAMMGGVIFCPVCREALVLEIYRFVDPIDDHAPKHESDAPRKGRGPFDFEVTIMKPKTHNLAVTWWVLQKDQAIKVSSPGPYKDRKRRGRLQPIQAKPAKKLANSGKRVQHFTLNAGKLAPGIYQVICRVEDDTKPAGQQWPWVLADPQQLLVSERSWWVEVLPGR